jgi:hypothetical protein
LAILDFFQLILEYGVPRVITKLNGPACFIYVVGQSKLPDPIETAENRLNFSQRQELSIILSEDQPSHVNLKINSFYKV